jgi:hypothetical protein
MQSTMIAPPMNQEMQDVNQTEPAAAVTSPVVHQEVQEVNHPPETEAAVGRSLRRTLPTSVDQARRSSPLRFPRRKSTC